MKILFETYTFNAASKQITFNTTDVVTLEQLLVITNVTTNRIIYNFADPSAGGSIVNNVLTLDYNTTSMSSTDKLQIFIDNNATPASEDTLQALQDQTALLSRMVKLLEPSSVVGSTGRQQVDISSMPQTVTGANITYMGGALNSNFTVAETTLFPQSRQSYALIRRNLEFS
jgi:hypothetical protein